MNFDEFKQVFQENFVNKISDINHLFTVNIDMDAFWELYLDSFPKGSNEIFRKRREFDCSSCRHFIKRFGNVVILKNNSIQSIWKFKVSDPVYQSVIDALDKFIMKKPEISGVYVSKEQLIGTDKNYERFENGEVREWQHLSVTLPTRFVNSGYDSIDTIKGNFNAIHQVFKRSLDELTLESIDTVLDLINSNTLYKGEEWKGPLQQFKKYKEDYDSSKNKVTYAWEMSVQAGPVVGKIRNHSIGTLLIDVSNDMDLDDAVRRYESVVAPTNYKRPKAIFTKKMLEDAKKTIEDLGYMPSLSRRYATLDDITINNILFANRDASKKISGDIFDELSSEIAVDPKKFSKIEEVPLTKFLADILPTAREIEVFLENKLSSNMVSLIAPANSDSKLMFKWDNGFSWAYTGNITDSNIKENVKLAGGNISGVLRFSIQWNDTGSYDGNDLDAHCIEPNNNRIYFVKKSGHRSSGSLDVDIIHPAQGKIAVENIVWTNKSRMPKGTYQLLVNQYNNRGGKDGFRAEVEFDGQIFEFSYPRELRQGEFVPVADVMFDGEKFTLIEKISSTMSTRDVWGLKTNQFIPATIIMYSPNYWDEQDGIGHRHVFFMLNNCKNPESPNGYYNEFLKQELYEHKRVFEALGSRSAVKETDNQLSGVGFSTTKRNSVIVKVKSNVERVIKVVI